MSAQLSPTPVFKGWANDGTPLAYGILTSYKAGTTTPQATYVDSTQTTQNTNPIILDARGECALWLDPLLTYKFALTDAQGNSISRYPVDNITNLPQYISSTNVHYVQTSAEIAAGIVPVNDTYLPGDPARYDGSGGTDYKQAFISSFTINQPSVIPARLYPISDLIYVPATPAAKGIFFYPGAKITSSQPVGSANGIFQFGASGTLDRLIIVGNGVQLGYGSAPTSRTNHVVYVNASAITNIEIDGLDILNGANMAIAIFGGLLGTSATGSTGAYVHDCRINGTLGDGVHVENFDSNVEIRDITLTGVQDDNVAVLNYNGTSGAATHNTQTTGVIIKGIRAKAVQTGTVSFAGINQFIIDDIEEEANTSFSVLTIKGTHATGYTVGNSAGSIDNIVTTGATKVLALDAPGAVTASLGTQFQQDIRIGQVVAHDVLTQGFSFSNVGTAAGGQIKNIEIDQLEIHGSGLSGAQIGFAANVDNFSLVRMYADSFGTGFQITGSNWRWGDIKIRGYVAATATGMVVSTCNVESAGSLSMDATNCTTGLQYQSNTLTVHNGLWNVTGAGTTQILFGSNTNVRGFFDVSNGYTSIGSVTGGTTATLTYTRAAPSTANFVLLVTIYSDGGLRWGVKNVLFNQATMLWTDSTTNVFIGYTFSVQAL